MGKRSKRLGAARDKVERLKLHSVVLASAVHVPSIMIEYQPKCADFQASLGRSGWSVRADRVDAGRLVELVESLECRYSQERAALTEAVLALRARLRDEVRAIDRTLTRTG